jgi:DoxX-like family
MNERWNVIIYWCSTSLVALLFAAPGLALVLRDSHFVAEMTRLGYPGYFLPFLGIWKILGAIVIAIPGVRYLKEWAYAGMVFDISGAIVSRMAAGDQGPELVLPFVIAGLVALSWGLRPDDRRFLRQTKLSREARDVA